MAGPSSDRLERKINELRSSFSDVILILGFLSGLSAQVFIVIRDGFNFIEPLSLLRPVILIVFLILIFQRKRLSAEWKMYIVAGFSALLFIASVSNFGLFSGFKLFPLLGSLMMVFLLSKRIILSIVGTAVVIYGLISVALANGLMTYLIQPELLMKNPYHWAVDLIFCFLAGGICIFMVSRFHAELTITIQETTVQNEALEITKGEIGRYNANMFAMIEEKVSDLKGVVDDIGTQNEMLTSLNQLVLTQNQDLEVATERLSQARDQMILSDRMASVGMLTAGVVHEIRNPLNHFHGLLMLLRKKVGAGDADPDLDRILSMLQEGYKRIRDVMDSLNRFDRGSPGVEEAVDLPEVIAACRNVLNSLFTPGMSYDFRSTHSSVVLTLDADRLHQIIINVLQNAIEALNETGNIRVSLSSTKDEVLISVTDDGCGISAADLPVITDPFFSTKPSGEHTGLGLFHVQKLMEECNGKLSFESVPGRGTTVNMVFPGPVRFSKDA